MRMWAADPKKMCRKHLLGEHLEMHMFAGHLVRGRRLGKYEPLVETAKIQERHDALAAEMERRGYSHRSPLAYKCTHAAGHLDRAASLAELLRRCDECRALHQATPQRKRRAA